MSETQKDVRPLKSSAARLTGPALESRYRFILWLVPAREFMPGLRPGSKCDTVSPWLSRPTRLHCRDAARSRRSRPTGYGARPRDRGRVLRMSGLVTRADLRADLASLERNKPRNLRSANRNRNTTDNRSNNGFRVARTLSSRSRRRHGGAGSAVSVQGGS